MKRNDGEETGWRDVPGEELVEAGLLHAVNVDWFWPLGLSLTGRKWDMGRAVASDLGRALGSVLVDDPEGNGLWFNGTVDELVEALGDAMAGHVMDGFYITEPVPPEPIETGLVFAEAAARLDRAHTWMRARRAKIRGIDETS